MICVQGRHIMWGWLQERRTVGSYDYAGCLSLPRVMYISGNRLHQVQQPYPPIPSLCKGAAKVPDARARFTSS